MLIPALLIPGRFNGPPGSGNGGYSAGLIAARLAAAGPDLTATDPPGPDRAGTGPARADRAGSAALLGRGLEVTLRLPPPLDTELTVTAEGDGIEVHHGQALVAAARPSASAEVAPRVPHVPRDEAAKISQNYPGFAAHPFPTCYSCGPERADGLRLFPGRMADGRTAAPFTVPHDVGYPTVWAALDCPGGWCMDLTGSPGQSDPPRTVPGRPARPYVLGRITAWVNRVPEPDSECVVTGKLLGEEGRKAHVATTLWPADGGEPYAAARATWIALTR